MHTYIHYTYRDLHSVSSPSSESWTEQYYISRSQSSLFTGWFLFRASHECGHGHWAETGRISGAQWSTRGPQCWAAAPLHWQYLLGFGHLFRMPPPGSCLCDCIQRATQWEETSGWIWDTKGWGAEGCLGCLTCCYSSVLIHLKLHLNIVSTKQRGVSRSSVHFK